MNNGAHLHFTSKEYLPTGEPRAVVFFATSFMTPCRVYSSYIKTLTAEGMLVIAYDYDSGGMLQTSPETNLDLSKRIAADMRKKVRACSKKYPGIRFGAMGISFGSTFILHAAKIANCFERIVIVTIAGHGAQMVLDYPGLSNMRTIFAERGNSLDEMYKTFKYLEPTYKIDKLKECKMIVFASEGDPIIKFSNTKFFLDAAKSAGLPVKFRQVKARRHTTTIYKSLRQRQVWVTFLEDLTNPVPKPRTVKSKLLGVELLAKPTL